MPATDASPIRHVEQRGGGAFLMERDGQRIAEMTYAIDENGSAVIDHTHVSPVLRGQGVGMQLVQAAVDWARGAGIKVVPVCSYARAVFERERGFADVLQA